MSVGRRSDGSPVSDGSLPVFAVSTLAEAEALLGAARASGVIVGPGWDALRRRRHGETVDVGVAAGLQERQTLDNLTAFSLQLAEAHEVLVAEGACECDPEWWPTFSTTLDDEEDDEAGGEDECVCGHVRDEHEDGFFSACSVCPCIDYEASS